MEGIFVTRKRNVNIYSKINLLERVERENIELTEKEMNERHWKIVRTIKYMTTREKERLDIWISEEANRRVIEREINSSISYMKWKLQTYRPNNISIQQHLQLQPNPQPNLAQHKHTTNCGIVNTRNERLELFTNNLLGELSNEDKVLILHIPSHQNINKPWLIYIQKIELNTNLHDGLITRRERKRQSESYKPNLNHTYIRIYNLYQMIQQNWNRWNRKLSKREREKEEERIPISCLPQLRNGSNMSIGGKYDKEDNCLIFDNTNSLYNILEQLVYRSEKFPIENIGFAYHDDIRSLLEIRRTNLHTLPTETRIHIRQNSIKTHLHISSTGFETRVGQNIIKTISINQSYSCLKRIILCMRLKFDIYDDIIFYMSSFLFYNKFFEMDD